MSKANMRAIFNTGVTKQEAWNSLTEMFKGSVSTLIPGGYGGSLSPVKNDDEIKAGDVFQNSQRKLTIREWAPHESFSYKEEAVSKAMVSAVMSFSVAEKGKDLVLNVVREQKKVGVGKLLPLGSAYGQLQSVAGSSNAYAAGWGDLPIHNIELSKG